MAQSRPFHCLWRSGHEGLTFWEEYKSEHTNKRAPNYEVYPAWAQAVFDHAVSLCTSGKPDLTKDYVLEIVAKANGPYGVSEIVMQKTCALADKSKGHRVKARDTAFERMVEIAYAFPERQAQPRDGRLMRCLGGETES